MVIKQNKGGLHSYLITIFLHHSIKCQYIAEPYPISEPDVLPVTQPIPKIIVHANQTVAKQQCIMCIVHATDFHHLSLSLYVDVHDKNVCGKFVSSHVST